jgi:3-methyladenine DNA glycosylase AlkD
MLTVPAVARALEALATPEQKANAEAYFKGVLPFLGVKGPQLNACFKEHAGQLAALSPEARFAFAQDALDQEAAELRHFGILTFSRDVKRLPAGWLQTLRPLLERRATNWGTADAFAGRVMRFRLPHDADRAELVTWAGAESPWLRRIACVAFVNEARKGVYAEEIRKVVRGALALDHRFSQLGAGWLLRERWRAAPAEVEVEAFLRAAGPAMQREAVRYAVEKMPPALRAELLTATR